MKRTILTILMAFTILLTAGAASAEVEYLTVTENGDIGCGNITVEVNYGLQTVSINFIGLDPIYGPSVDPGIYNIWLNLAPGIDVVGGQYDGTLLAAGDVVRKPDGTPITQLFNVNGFGRFNTEISLPTDAGARTTGPVIIDLSGPNYLTPNSVGKSIALHVASLGTPDPVDGSTLSTHVTSGDCNGGTTTGGDDIPEFPTIALPIAAIIGLAFIFQRRKE